MGGGLLLLGVALMSVWPPALSNAGPASLKGDVNGDGCVNDVDLAEIDVWRGERVTATHPITGPLDVNHDGMVNGLDYDLAIDNYGSCE